MRKIAVIVLMLALVLGGQYMAWRQRSAITVTTEEIAGNPVDYFHSAAEGAAHNVVIVAHGFASNKEMMRPWGYYLAARGFDTYVIDEPGHGASTHSLPRWTGVEDNALGANLSVIIDQLVAERRAEPGHIALVGHSMGGAAVTQAALVDDRIKVTVGLSSAYGRPIPEGKPVNLLSLAAERDPSSIYKAVATLAAQSDGGKGQLGKQYGSFQDATARESDAVNGRNHITILYDANVQDRVADWISQGLGVKPAAYVDYNYGWLWLMLAMAGALGFVVSVAALLAPPEARRQVRNLPRVGFSVGLMMVAVAAFAAVLGVVYIRISWLHLAVVDYLLPYFLLMALVLLALRLFWPKDFGFQIITDQERDLGGIGRGLIIFLGLVLAVGTVIHMNFSNFVPTAHRLLLMVPLAIALWLFHVQEEGLKRAVANDAGPWAGLMVGLVGKLVIVLTWMGASALPNPQPFLPLTLPVIAPLLFMLELMSYLLSRWRYPATAAATFTSLMMVWAVVVSFPLV